MVFLSLVGIAGLVVIAWTLWDGHHQKSESGNVVNN